MILSASQTGTQHNSDSYNPCSEEVTFGLSNSAGKDTASDNSSLCVYNLSSDHAVLNKTVTNRLCT